MSADYAFSQKWMENTGNHGCTEEEVWKELRRVRDHGTLREVLNFIMDSIWWSQTPHGYSRWNEVHDRLVAGEPMARLEVVVLLNELENLKT